MLEVLCTMCIKGRNFICLVSFLLFFVCMTEGHQRCFKCNSGELGICGDPFKSNVTFVELNKTTGVEAVPCKSTWCGKITTPGTNFKTENGITQRICLEKGPKNGEEICSHLSYANRTVQLCICKGDLCNSSKSMDINHILVLSAALVSFKLIFLLY